MESKKELSAEEMDQITGGSISEFILKIFTFGLYGSSADNKSANEVEFGDGFYYFE